MEPESGGYLDIQASQGLSERTRSSRAKSRKVGAKGYPLGLL
jgi:hypothetical protein